MISSLIERFVQINNFPSINYLFVIDCHIAQLLKNGKYFLLIERGLGLHKLEFAERASYDRQTLLRMVEGASNYSSNDV